MNGGMNGHRAQRSDRGAGNRRAAVKVVNAFLLLVVAVLGFAVIAGPSDASGSLEVVVYEADGAAGDARDAVDALGGTIIGEADAVGGFIAEMPVGTVGSLSLHPSTRLVTFTGILPAT